MRMLAYVLLALPACSTGDPPLTESEYDDVARSVAGSTSTPGGGGDVGAMTDSVLLAGGNLPLGFTVDAAGAYHGEHVGLAYRYALECRDGEGTIQHCNPTAELADVHLGWSGMLAVPGLSASVSRAGVWSLAGMHASAIKLAGLGHFAYDAMIASTAYHFDYDAVYIGVRVDKLSMLAIGGEIRYAITAQKTADVELGSFSVAATVTFDSDSTATITLDDLHAYKVSLVTGRLDKMR